MGNTIRILFSAALLLAPSLPAHAEPGSEQIPHPASASRQTGLSEKKDGPELAAPNNLLRVPPAALRSYDGNALPGASGFGYRPAGSTLRLIDSGGFKIELRNDGHGHYALVTPLLMGAGVGGEARRGGGVFRFSWPTNN